MGFINRIIIYSITIGLVFFIGYLTAAIGQDKLNHPGRVVDMKTGTPASVDVKAWPQSGPTGDDGGCPKYGKEALDSTTSSSSNGRFNLSIDSSKSTYTTTYCANGYVPRVDEDHRNKTDGFPVMPNPVSVLKKEYNNKRDYAFIVRNKIVGVMSDLAYLKRSNPDYYATAINVVTDQLGSINKNYAQMVMMFDNMVRDWNQ